MTELCEVVITAPDPDWLKDFSRKLVEQRLCASAHNFAPVQSIYRWRGEICERTEGRVSLHTRRDRVAEIVAVAKQEHPYEVPGVSTRTITDGNPDYLTWIAQETTRAAADAGAAEHSAPQTGSSSIHRKEDTQLLHGMGVRATLGRKWEVWP
jgi:periplasmic divalent cation tolerance protein